MIHDEHGKNPHAHVMYAGRALDGPDQFDKHRDREQDQKRDPRKGKLSITDLHSQFWIETLHEAGHEASFEPVAESGAQDHIGPTAWAREQKAIQSEIAAAITQALDPDQPIDAGDAIKAARAATASLTVTDALALDRDPVTAEMIVARKPIRKILPVALDPPQRSAAPAIALPPAPSPRALPVAALAPPQRLAAAAIALPPALGPLAVPLVALQPPQRLAAAAIALPPALGPLAVPLVVLQPPQRRAAPPVRLPTPLHIEDKR